MSDATRSLREGLEFGVLAGLALAASETVYSVFAGQPAQTPIHMAASLMLGASAFAGTSTALVIVVGAIVHLCLSAVYGAFYGVYNSALTMETRRSWNRQAVLGLLFGFMLWLVNFQFFARAHFPWFLDGPHGPHIVTHAVFYGLPLALMYAAAERRVRPVQAPLAYR